MRSLNSVLCGLFAAVISSSAAVAASDPSVNTVVTPVPGNEQVTLSRAGTSKQNLPLVTYAGYLATMTNGATNTLNRVFLTGTASSDGTDTVAFDSSIPAGLCSAGTAPNMVTCSLASLPPGTVSPPLIVVFKAPTTGSQIRFDWTAGGFEGNGVGTGCCSQTGFATTSLVDPTSDPLFKTTAKTFVKTTGGKVFTGDEAITTSGDGWSTIVDIPGFASSPLGAYTLATIAENQLSQSCAPYALANGCFTSELTIPGSFVAGLAITIRWDKSFFNLAGTHPADVKLFYQHLPTDTAVQVNLCSFDLANLPAGVTTAPSSGKPCMPVAPRILKSQDTSVKDLVGDLEFKVNALDNGKYAN